MKAHFKFALSALVGVCGLMSEPCSALTMTREHATVCKPYGERNAAGLYSHIGGVTNVSPTSMAVVCPVVRTAGPIREFIVLVNGAAGTGQVSCSMYSYDWNSAYLGSFTSYASGSPFSMVLRLPSAAVPFFSAQSVYCNLPPNGALYSIEPYENSF